MRIGACAGKDGRSFAVQITPSSKATAADCKALEGSGKECFSKIGAPATSVLSQLPSIATAGTVVSGTGFYVSRNHQLLTNAHVVDSCRQIRVGTVSSGTGTAQVIGQDSWNDLALLTSDIQQLNIPQLRLSPRLGEDIVVDGFPLSGMLASSGNVTAGNVTALAGLGNDSRLMQISAPGQPGSSGGPVRDRNGSVVGIIVSKLDALNLAVAIRDIPQNVNFAIKSSVVASFLGANGVNIPSAEYGGTYGRQRLSTADLADRAKAFTVHLECIQ
jgi:serine protease Do